MHMKGVDMMRIFSIILTILLIFFSSSFAEENSGTTQKALTLEEIGQKEARENVSNNLQKLANHLLQSAETKYNNCLKAFGDEEFCRCIKNKTPSGITFAEYIEIIINTKEDLGYSQSDNATKVMIDNTIKARETCVSVPDETVKR
jgi:hypothetical protein